MSVKQLALLRYYLYLKHVSETVALLRYYYTSNMSVKPPALLRYYYTSNMSVKQPALLIYYYTSNMSVKQPALLRYYYTSNMSTKQPAFLRYYQHLKHVKGPAGLATHVSNLSGQWGHCSPLMPRWDSWWFHSLVLLVATKSQSLQGNLTFSCSRSMWRRRFSRVMAWNAQSEHRNGRSPEKKQGEREQWKCICNISS